MDPETGFDGIANVGVDGASITAVGDTVLRGRKVIDAKGLVVAPGFIDILSYEPNPYGIWFKVADGVTTNLGLHGLRSRGRLLQRLRLGGEPPAHELRRRVQRSVDPRPARLGDRRRRDDGADRPARRDG